ncbi:piggyBac transposable element-derived protein 3-like [Astatotilapia calliptera]|uniref:piggyBac transposable element-derived protein 3-like n=1 Tax=Astatotilapia calliptera TaxID=8154 RepID=UPI000E403CB3|nr:piggyBac transposable element-derived protein 3-like [Astatotilapia calliptera]
MADANHPGKRYTVAEILAMLQDSETVADITVVPESEMHAHDTDCDSDQSDDEATGDHNRLPSRILKGEGFLPNSDMQLPNPPDDDPGCSSSVSQTETRKVSGTNENVTSQIAGPMLHKTKNQDRKFKKIKIAAKAGLGLGLAEKAEVPPGVKFYHDNLFTTLSLVDEMTLRGYGSCGTMRQTQLHNVPFTAPQTFKKTPRGDAEYLVEAEKLIVRWNDNSVVTVVSNMEREFTETEAKRWNKQKRTMDKVRQPKCIQDYNTHMGGVDLHDQFVSRYRVNIRSKKWWWPCFSWALNSAMVNSWCYYRSWKSGEKDLLSFQRLVAQTLLLRHGTKPSRQGRRSSMAVAITDATRFDNLNHWPCNTGSRYKRCKNCGGRTSFACGKCDVLLHVECFKKYHTE